MARGPRTTERPHPVSVRVGRSAGALVACLAVGVFAPRSGRSSSRSGSCSASDRPRGVRRGGRRLALGDLAGVEALPFAVDGAIGVELLRLKRKAAGDLALALYVGIAMGAVFESRAGRSRARDAPVPVRRSTPSRGRASRWSAPSARSSWSHAPRRAGAVHAVVTDEDWSRVAGLPVGALSVALAALTGVIVAGMRVVGIRRSRR